MADEDFHRRLPFTFLEDIKGQFQIRYGDQSQRAIAFAMNEDFQRIIRQQMDYYNTNPAAQEDSVVRVQNQLDSVKDVMVANIEKVLERGEKIELLVDRTDRLSQQAFRFEKKSKHLKRSVHWANCKRWLFASILLLVRRHTIDRLLV